MDDDHHVGGGDQPRRALQRDEDVVANVAPKGPAPEERDGEVAGGSDEVCGDDALPHGRPGRLGWRGRDGGLDLQHHAVPRVRGRHLPQRAEHPERRVRHHAGLVQWRPWRVISAGPPRSRSNFYCRFFSSHSSSAQMRSGLLPSGRILTCGLLPPATSG